MLVYHKKTLKDAEIYIFFKYCSEPIKNWSKKTLCDELCIFSVLFCFNIVGNI